MEVVELQEETPPREVSTAVASSLLRIIFCMRKRDEENEYHTENILNFAVCVALILSLATDIQVLTACGQASDLVASQRGFLIGIVVIKTLVSCGHMAMSISHAVMLAKK